MLRDSCPTCDFWEEKPHQATTVTVTPSWSNRPHVRCTACQKPASHRIHTR